MTTVRRAFILLLGGLILLSASRPAQDPAGGTNARFPDAPLGPPPVIKLEAAAAVDEASMQAYSEEITGSDASVSMTPIRAGSFLLGSPSGESDRKAAEGPQVEVNISAFWMATHELSWKAYEVFQHSLDVELRRREERPATPQDAWADSVSRPTPPYVPMDFGMGMKDRPAICMTQFAAKQYTKWLSMKTGRFYRLPTEAEWEYACRAGGKTAYSFKGGEDAIDDNAWYFDNADDEYRAMGALPANAWGLFDMHGNVTEWCLDAYDKDFYATLKAGAQDPINWPEDLFPRSVRGGSWDDDPDALRSAARRGSKAGWKVQDPQLPKSIWYHTDAQFLGFRVVRPLKQPSLEEMARYWEADLDSIRAIQNKQRQGGR